MFHRTHLHRNNFDNKCFNKDGFENEIDDLEGSKGFNLKNFYNLWQNRSEVPMDSGTVVNELTETSPGVWECEVLIPLKGEDSPKLKSIYRSKGQAPNLDYQNFYRSQTQNSAQDTYSKKDDTKDNSKEVDNVFCGGFIPVFGPRGFNFPPDYRLSQSRLGPQHKSVQPGFVYNPVPSFFNNQFIRPARQTRLARWDSVTPDNSYSWDPFNLKCHNIHFQSPPLRHNSSFSPSSLNSGSFSREVLVYPNRNFTHSLRN